MNMRLSFIALALSLCGVSAQARVVTSMNGSWDFAFGGGDFISVDVPHTWNAKDGADGNEGKKPSALSAQGDGYKRGTGIYMKELPAKPGKGKRYFIRFEGVSQVADVEVNDKKIGRHEGAFGAFCFEVTDFLTEKSKNTVTVKADNTHQKHILPLSGDFSLFGGVYRPVSLIQTDSVCIKPDYYASPGVFITQEKLDEKEGVVKVSTLISAQESKAKEVTVKITITDAKGKIVAESSETLPITPGTNELKSQQQLTVASPQLWQARENPYLYKVSCSLKTDDGQSDEMVQPLGFRTATIEPQRGFLLNGKPMQIKGVNRHQDRQGKGWAVSPKDEAEDMQMILDMGADGLRTAHYAQSRNIYDICDKNGIIVWSEVTAVEKVMDTPEFKENMLNQASELVLQHGNHPSICMWGIFNEIYHQCGKEVEGIDMEGVLKELNAYIKKLDTTRFTVGATNKLGKPELNRIPDFFAANLYPGWYGGGPEGMGAQLDGILKNYPDRRASVSEYGHGASVNMHEYPAKQPSPGGRWHPEEWQSLGHEGNYKSIKARPQVWGTYIWNMFDFASDSRREGEFAGMNDKGLVTYDRKTRKDAYYFYKANWNPELMCYISSRRFTKRNMGTVEVKVYSNADSLTLSVNGKVVGESVKPDDLRRAIWSDVVLKPGRNTIKVTGKTGKKTVSDSCTWTYSVPKEEVKVDKMDTAKPEKK